MRLDQFYRELVRYDNSLHNLFNVRRDLIEFPVFPENHEEVIFGKELVTAHKNSLETRMGSSAEAKKPKPNFVKHLSPREKEYFYGGTKAKIQRPNQDLIKLIDGLGEIGKLENYQVEFLRFLHSNKIVNEIEKSQINREFNSRYNPKRDKGIYGQTRAFKDALYTFSVSEVRTYMEEFGMDEKGKVITLDAENLAK